MATRNLPGQAGGPGQAKALEEAYLALLVRYLGKRFPLRGWVIPLVRFTQ